MPIPLTPALSQEERERRKLVPGCFERRVVTLDDTAVDRDAGSAFTLEAGRWYQLSA